MRAPIVAFLGFMAAGVIPGLGMAEPVQFDVEGAHVIVARPADVWDPNKAGAKQALDSIGDRGFIFNYIDAGGNKIWPRPKGLFAAEVATPLSVEVHRLRDEGGFRQHVNYTYEIGAPTKLEAGRMAELIRVQNALYRAWVLRQGDPSTLESRTSAMRAVNVLVAAGVGLKGFGLNLSQSSALYSDVAQLTSGMASALMPVPLPEHDFSGYAEVEVRRVTDNSQHVGEIIIGYRNPKTDDVERLALARGIATASGVGTTVDAVKLARQKDYEQRLAIWTECQASPACAKQ
jgi:hypothetical protein